VNNIISTLKHPRKSVVSLAEGMSWTADDSIFQEKIDGVFNVLQIGDSFLTGDKLKSGRFVAWDCVQFQGQDVRGFPAYLRHGHMRQLCDVNNVLMAETSANGAELLERVLKRGGEGVCRKAPYSSYYDTMEACKRLQTWICRVVAFCGGSQSVEIADLASGELRGKVALRGGKCDRVRIGSVVKVEGLCLLPSGMIRESRVCSDTPNSWLVSF
jgi:hypothetical protein